MDTKSFGFEVKDISEQGVVEGYASVFRSTPDSDGDIIKSGAFTKTLSERIGKVKVCFGHDWGNIIGKPIEMREDHHGLWTRSQLFLDPDIPEGRRAYALAKAGVLDELSIGFQTVKWAPLEGVDGKSGFKGREIHEIKLYEYSLVPFAADDQAIVTGVKSLDDDALIRQFATLTEVLTDTKAGRVLSQANLDRLRSAIDALQEVLAAAEPEPQKAAATQALLVDARQLYAEYQRNRARFNGAPV